jgi:XTP/dITP diphosphohydrolase
MTIVFATNNLNKLKEVQALMPNHIKLLSLKDINCFDDVPETQETIKGNAIQKVEYIKANYNLDCFADDTGLEVEALNGAPGVYSARFAGPQRNADDNTTKLLNDLKNKTNRAAQFKTVIALNINGEQQLFEGIAKGVITLEKKGADGFGYDPIFQPLGYTSTFAEISMEEKATISHRGIATRKLINYLSK